MALSSLAVFLLLLPLAASLPSPSSANDAADSDFVVANAANTKAIIPNSYIVVWPSNSSDSSIAARQAKLSTELKKRNTGKLNLDGKPLNTKATPVSFQGFRAWVCEAEAPTIKAMVADNLTVHEKPAYVEQAQTFSVFNAEQDWDKVPRAVSSLADFRVDASASDSLDSSNATDGNANGTVITVYVLDTGVNVNHTELKGRAFTRNNLNFVRNESPRDNNGHGTFCASLIAGSDVGVAQEVAQIVAVKVADKDGGGESSWILEGLRAVCEDVEREKRQGTCVVSMSLGTPKSAALNQAAAQVDKCGCVVVVAAGNEGANATGVSPASEPRVLTVGASNTTSKSSKTKGKNTITAADFSNFGKSVDIYAPGVNVVGADGKTSDELTVLSGTSMSCPQVAGMAAIILSQGTVNCTNGCTGPVRRKIREEGKEGAPVADTPKGTTSVNLDTSGLVPIAQSGKGSS